MFLFNIVSKSNMIHWTPKVFEKSTFQYLFIYNTHKSKLNILLEMCQWFKPAIWKEAAQWLKRHLARKKASHPLWDLQLCFHGERRKKSSSLNLLSWYTRGCHLPLKVLFERLEIWTELSLTNNVHTLGAWMAQGYFSLVTAAAQFRFPASTCGRVVVAHQRLVVFSQFFLSRLRECNFKLGWAFCLNIVK